MQSRNAGGRRWSCPPYLVHFRQTTQTERHWSRCTSQQQRRAPHGPPTQRRMRSKTGTDPWAMSWRHFDFALHLEMYSTQPEPAHTRGSCPAGDAAPAQGDDGPLNLAEPKEPRLSGGQKRKEKSHRSSRDAESSRRRCWTTANQHPDVAHDPGFLPKRRPTAVYALEPFAHLDCFPRAAIASSNDNVAATWVLGSRAARPLLAVEPPLNRQIRHPIFRSRGWKTYE